MRSRNRRCDLRNVGQEVRLFRHLKGCSERSIAAGHPLIRDLGLQPGVVLVLKQSVWEHQFPFTGVVLVRNPVSIFASLSLYDSHDDSGDLATSWKANTARLTRWLDDIDPVLSPCLRGLSPIEQFCLFYNRRMGALTDLGLPVIHYERFVTSSTAVLPAILDAIGVEFSPHLVNSHVDFKSRRMGHGKNDLARPIDRKSLTLYRRAMDEAQFEAVADGTAAVSSAFGYIMTWRKMQVNYRGALLWSEDSEDDSVIAVQPPAA